MSLNLGTDSKLKRVMNAVAAGTSDQNSASVDMTGFDNVLFGALFGAITAGAVTSIKAQQSDDDGVADDWTDLAGTAVTVADDDDDKLFWLEVVQPEKRYVRLVVDRGTQNAVIDGVIAIQTNPKHIPTTHDAATVGGGEVHASPAEGTA